MSSPMPFVPPSEDGAMCCICWEYRPIAYLFVDKDGQAWDLCCESVSDCANKAGGEDLA